MTTYEVAITGLLDRDLAELLAAQIERGLPSEASLTVIVRDVETAEAQDSD